MTTVGQFNSKNPTIKRILKEANELSSSPSPDYHAAPLDNNLFEWHFTLSGPPNPSPYAGGIYHGRIVLPNTYPLRPPSFRFLTPSGRFEVNREICLSISGHHEETWQPAWGVRTALVAIRSFMDTDVKGQVGGIECAAVDRKAMAKTSKGWTCSTCGKSNETLLSEQEVVEDTSAEEKVPNELKLAYKDELAHNGPEILPKEESSPSKRDSNIENKIDINNRDSHLISISQQDTISISHQNTISTSLRNSTQLSRHTTRQDQSSWLDKAIIIIATILAFMVFRKLVAAIV